MDVGDGAISAARGQDLRPRLGLRVCVQKLDGQEPKAVLGVKVRLLKRRWRQASLINPKQHGFMAELLGSRNWAAIKVLHHSV